MIKKNLDTALDILDKIPETSRPIKKRHHVFCAVYARSGDGLEAMREAGYPQTSITFPNLARLLNKNYIQEEVAKHRERLSKLNTLTYEYKLSKLADGIDYYCDKKEYIFAAKLIEIANKMQGHNAPDKHLNVNAAVSFDKIKKKLEELEYKEY